MKKTLSVLFAISLLSVLVAPIMVSAQSGTPNECCRLTRDFTFSNLSITAVKNQVIGAPGGKCEINGIDTFIDVPTDSWGMVCLLNSLYNITDWIFLILVGIAGIWVLMGAFTLLTAGGNSEKVTSGRNYILYAAIGLAVALLAKAVPGIVRVVMGLST